jgi:epoxyqueuosine reductase
MDGGAFRLAACDAADRKRDNSMDTDQVLSRQILDKATTLGASLAGLVPLSALREPTRVLADRCGLSAERASLLVLALKHPDAEPELDWWGEGPGGTKGNRRLIAISRQLKRFLSEFDVGAHPLPYHPWKGGVLLKDAAVLAGLGCIGDNNLLITPPYGTRVRLRAILLDLQTEPEPGPAFAPCTTCDHSCWRACPQQAFSSGAYEKAPCARQMELDETNASARTQAQGNPVSIAYCRACELACPVSG